MIDADFLDAITLCLLNSMLYMASLVSFVKISKVLCRDSTFKKVDEKSFTYILDGTLQLVHDSFWEFSVMVASGVAIAFFYAMLLFSLGAFVLDLIQNSLGFGG